MRKYSIEQNNYMLAKAQHETLKEEYEANYEKLNLDELYEQNFDKAFELDEELNEKIGLSKSFDILCEAEKQLVEWCFTVVEKEPLYKKHFSDIEGLKERSQASIVTREKIAKLAMNLSA